MNGSGDIFNSVVGIYNFYDVSNGTNDNMVFYYPSYKDSAYSSLNYSIDQTIYQLLIDNQN